MTNRFVFSAHDESRTGIPRLNGSLNDSEPTGPALGTGKWRSGSQKSGLTRPCGSPNLPSTLQVGCSGGPAMKRLADLRHQRTLAEGTGFQADSPRFG